MQSVAKFVTKAYPVSGCFDYLSEVRTERSVSVCVCVCARARASIPVFQGTLILHWSQKCDRLPLECLDAQAPLKAK